jgi:glutamyl-tRNA synthetase
MVSPSQKPVRVRYAPSPTGNLHIGSVRTALFNWLFARQHKGVFVLRIEDTDGERSKSEFEKEIIEGLEWLGLSWDEGVFVENGIVVSKGEYGPYRQSERTEIYKKYLEQLLADGHAYYCYCTKEELEAERQGMLAQGMPAVYSGHCRELKEAPHGKKPELIRFKTPAVQVTFKDVIRGSVTFDAGLIGDMVIARNIESPLYNFVVAVDDHEMKISHVIRGEDHISNTPKQILIQKALGIDEPIYAHIPLILNTNRSKLSKRFNKTSLLEYQKQGYLSQAMVNFLALLGWHPANDNQEIFSADELLKVFDIRRVQKAGAIFNNQKLEWLNTEYIKRLDIKELVKSVVPFLEEKNIHPDQEFLERVILLERERMKTLGEFIELASFFFELPNYEAPLLIWRDSTQEKAKETLSEILRILKSASSPVLTRESLSQMLASLIEKEGRGSVLWPLRAALSGQATSPDPFAIAEVLERDEVVRRIEVALTKLNA